MELMPLLGASKQVGMRLYSKERRICYGNGRRGSVETRCNEGYSIVEWTMRECGDTLQCNEGSSSRMDDE